MLRIECFYETYQRDEQLTRFTGVLNVILVTTNSAAIEIPKRSAPINLPKIKAYAVGEVDGNVYQFAFLGPQLDVEFQHLQLAPAKWSGLFIHLFY